MSNFAQSFVQQAIDQVFYSMYFSEAAYRGQARLDPSAIGTVVRFSGAAEGEFRVAVTQSLAARMAADFLALEPEEISREQIESVVTEFANIACGATMSAWKPEAGFHFSVPDPVWVSSAEREYAHCFSISGDTADLAIDIRIP